MGVHLAKYIIATPLTASCGCEAEAEATALALDSNTHGHMPQSMVQRSCHAKAELLLHQCYGRSTAVHCKLPLDIVHIRSERCVGIAYYVVP